MGELVNIIITTAVGLGILGGSYALDLLVGTIKVLFTQGMHWSWKKMGEDLLKALLIAISVEAWVILWYVANWYTTKIGLDISEFANAMSVGGMIGAIGISAFWYLANAGGNLAEFLNTKHVEVKVDEDAIDYGAIVDKIKELADTLTGKSVKEQLADEGEKLDGKEISEEEAGQGGLANTYPEPYRSAKKDSMLDPSTCYNRECVSYCAWKICEVIGNWPPRTGSMSAKYWVDRLPSWGFKEVAGPKNGGKYVGVATDGTYGHVVWFEFDNTISEYNFADAGNYGVRAVNLGQYQWFEIKAPAPAPAPTPTPGKKVHYVYKQGDTFGQVICDLGLKTSHGLWGPDGDVAYYTQQLIDQGALDSNGNVIVGREIVLTPRKD